VSFYGAKTGFECHFMAQKRALSVILWRKNNFDRFKIFPIFRGVLSFQKKQINALLNILLNI